MRVSNTWMIIIVISAMICGCGKEEKRDYTELVIEMESDCLEEVEFTDENETISFKETEEGEEILELAVERKVELLYETVQKMIDEIEEECLVKPEEFGKTIYTEDKFDEIKQYEMNIVLDYLELKQWHRPTSSSDEKDLPVDEPLGEYTAEKLKEYTDEEHRLTIEYFCGGCILHKPDKRYIALIIKEYKEDIIQKLYYQIIDYGYLGVMTGSNSDTYDVNDRLEDIDRKKMEQGDMGYYVNLWIDEDAGEVNLIYDIGEEKREGVNGSYTSYAQSIWVICQKEEQGYKVKEIIPMRLR